MPESQRSLKVFLCHAHSDKDAVRNLYRRLTKDGVDAWLDKEKLLPGQDWEYEIRKAVREADVVVVCLSKQFNQAGFRQKEVRIAVETAMDQLDGDIFIIPARLEEVDVPERLQRYHWVNLFDENGYEILKKALEVRDEQIERARIQKEEAVKRRLPFFETPVFRSTVTQEDSENSINIVNKHREDDTFHVSSTNPEHPKSMEQSSRKKSLGKHRIKTEYIVAVIGATATVIAGLLSSPLIEKWFSSASVPTETASATVTLTYQSTAPSQFLELTQLSQTSTITPTENFTSTVIPLQTEITDAKGVEMVLVPAGEFTMGDDADDGYNFCEDYLTECERKMFEDQEPVHKVYLISYYVDKFEVTNVLYKACVDAGFCKIPQEISSATRLNYYGTPEFDDYPVIYVDWRMAKTYCEWRNARLPTEAEWEKAARGTDRRTFPWGETADCSYANFSNCTGDTSQVGSYPTGKSVYGIYDMSGNVWEWVSSVYLPYPYVMTDGRENLNTSQVLKIWRGGTWGTGYGYSTTTYRQEEPWYNAYRSIGFRCARDVNP